MTDLLPGWSVARLTDFCHIEMGQAPPSSSYNAEGIGLPLYQGKAEFGELFPKPRKYCSEPSKVGPEGSVLLSVRAPVGPTNIAPHKCAIGRGLAAILPLGGIPNRFVLWGLREKEAVLAKGATGSTFAAISKSDVVSIAFGLPPLNEQRRIVEKIETLFDQIDKGVESLQTARTTLGLYRQSLLKSAFEGRLTADWRAQNADKLEAPQTLLARIQRERDTRYKAALAAWQKAIAAWRADGEKGRKPAKPKRPDDVSAVDQSEAREVGDIPTAWAWIRPMLIAEPSPHAIGIGPFGSNLKVSDYRKEGIPLVFVRNITQEDFSLSQKFVSREKAAELDAHSIQAGDVLVTKMGDPPGDCTVYPDDGPYAIITADCLKFRVWEQFADRRFVSFMIRSNAVKRQLGLITQGVAQKKISVARFKTIALPLPSIAEQAEIVRILDARLEAADALETEIDAALTRADALRQSILKKAFAGQLVPQDPKDEPATVLLARIKAERAKTAKPGRKHKALT